MNLIANISKGLPLRTPVLASDQMLFKQVLCVLGKEAQKGPLLFDDLPPASSTDSGTVFRLSQVCVNVSSWGCSCLNLSPFPPFSTHRCFRCWTVLSFESMASGKAEKNPLVASPEELRKNVEQFSLVRLSVYFTS